MGASYESACYDALVPGKAIHARKLTNQLFFEYTFICIILTSSNAFTG